ncbi:MAG: hypothetical protein K8T26_09555 [Lentisphaerae bacterium]|nr:hypothetical protein [Lentisphaerota bacterium]
MKTKTQTKRSLPPARPYQQLIFAPRTHDLKHFEELGRAAKDAGFTHLYISQLRDRTDSRGDEANSPWTEWSLVLPSIFKHVTPPGLEDGFDQAFVRRQFDWMKRKHAICAKLGLRAAYFGCEPHWLSERVYAKHPEWRGARCDNSLRSIGMFFAPNTEHPGVREAYRAGVERIVRACPLIDTFSLATNDSGAGFIWSQKLYVNPNGPTGFEGRDMGHMVEGFLELIRAGAMDGGADDPRVFIDNWFSPDEKKLVARSMRPGIGINGTLPSDDAEKVRECSLANAGVWSAGGNVNMDSYIASYPCPQDVLGAASAINSGRVARWHTGGSSTDYFAALKIALKLPPAKTPLDKVQALMALAAELYGANVADDVVAAWQTLERADIIAGASCADAFGGPVMFRWLTRPLVAHQELLTEDEKAYWTKPVYQSRESEPDSYLDYCNPCGIRDPDNWWDATRIALGIDQIDGTLAEAAGILKAASEKAEQPEARKALLLDHYRVLVRRSMFLTTRHFVQVGTLIRLRDQQLAQLTARGEVMGSTKPERPDLPIGNGGSAGLFFMHRALRWELDNVNALIKILESCPEPILMTAPDEAREGSLVLGPNVLKHLRLKVQIMLKHWRDAEIGWYRPTLGG